MQNVNNTQLTSNVGAPPASTAGTTPAWLNTSSQPRPLLRSISAPKLLVEHAKASQVREDLLKHPLVRGVGGSGETFHALRAIAGGKQTVLPLLWGFRKPIEKEPGLNGAERNTMHAYVNLVNSLGSHCQPVLILADEHAMHNGIDKSTWQQYYAAVQEYAGSIGLQTRYLSAIFKTLGLSGEALAKEGADLVDRPKTTPREGTVRLTCKDWAQLKRQSEHLCQRFPGQFPKPQGESQKRALYDPRALNYARFRAAEGRLLLPRLTEAFDGTPVLPVHVTGPEAERFGVRGLAIMAKDAHDASTVHIPWK